MKNNFFVTSSILIATFLGSASQVLAVEQKPALEDADVLKMASAARKALAEQHINGCIVIADPDGVPLYVERQVNATPNCLSAALGKAKSAAIFKTDTNVSYEGLVKGEVHNLAVPDLSSNPGGVPLFVGKTVVGSIAISTPDGSKDLAVVHAAAKAL
ncbi:GlcG/HbpS family heme-binding protein [Gluconobacter kondonii]|uniref:GlcG/HbpS family heme-binding protein n=1 Tax=Gluconobacter kondonii TaxID=941463 RepID=UPI00197F8F2B|nr:heme-binding protein [Gluconobacter kondonii]MBN3868335.1 heme-binding protein [Gluconobacter kondonii]MBS1053866.1 heme-binding protein [Gluconobacter kondonii]MBS1057547.1 heme-binding protein [Gluconobacter kondonii]MBS1066092.1 heme-binding protein [Gluconobacter kondonii]MBS1081197.1 heme-binding protein [Gluconobacter kondonii]